MACINPNDPEFKKILKQVGGNPLLAAIEFNKLYPEEGAVESEVIKPGVAELFDSNPELANIGTPEQYSQYLDTIFPDSKEKDIFYHGSSESTDPDKLSDFNNQGFYITNNLTYAKAYKKKGVVLRLIINSQYQYKKAEGISEVKETKKDRLDLLKNLEKIKSGELFGGANFGSFAAWGDFDVLTPFSFRFFKTKEEFYNANKYDNLTTIDQENVDDIINYVKNRLSEIQAGRAYDTVVTNAEGVWFKAIFDRKKAHFLGTKQDIEGFKEFVDKSTFKQLELDPEMSNYIADQISKAFNVPIPGMEKDTLITAEEIENFNRDVENRDGRLPSEYFTGIDDVNKWVLNKSELYDLVDKDTGEIYLKDVNLSTGQVEKQEVPSQPVSDKERQEAIDYLNNAVKDFRIDEILAERGYDVNDIISNLASAENKEEFDKIINKLLRLLC